MTARSLSHNDLPDLSASAKPRARGLFVFPRFPAESFAAVEMRALEPHLESMQILSIRGRPKAAAEELAQVGFQKAKVLHCAAPITECLKDLTFALGQGRRFWPEVASVWRENAARPSHALKAFGALAAALRIARLARGGNVDFVYVFWGHYLSCCIPLLKHAAPNVRTMIFLGAYGLTDYPRSLRRWSRQADGIFTHSEAHVAEIAALLGKDAAPPVFMIHRGIDLEACRNLMKAPARKEYDFCFVGRLLPVKGPLDFVDALVRLQRNGIGFSAAIIGDGPLRTELAGRLAASDLSDAVHLLGRQPHGKTLETIRSAKILVLPSTKPDEIYPNVIKEAMALDTACIAYDIPGVRAFNTQRPAVALCEPNNVGALAEAMQRLLHEGREELVLQGRHVVEAFDLKWTTQERLASMNRILHPPGLRSEGVDRGEN